MTRFDRARANIARQNLTATERRRLMSAVDRAEARWGIRIDRAEQRARQIARYKLRCALTRSLEQNAP